MWSEPGRNPGEIEGKSPFRPYVWWICPQRRPPPLSLPRDLYCTPAEVDVLFALAMKKRMLLMLVVVIAFVAAIGGFKYFQIKKMMSQSWTPPPEAVTTIVAQQASWPSTLNGPT